jgi:hypothetical protein
VELSAYWNGAAWMPLSERKSSMKLKYTGQADAPVTFQGKYQVETGDVVEADEFDANLLLQTGRLRC